MVGLVYDKGKIMKRIYAPWRSPYAESTHRTKDEKASAKECVFCKQLQEKNDDQHFIIKRFKHNAIILNRYPYNAGHILIIPLAHKATLDTISKATRTELMELLSMSSHLIQKVLDAHGINIGLNIGKAAGAGIPSHLHFHVLPRWSGDTNFLPTLTDTKLISFDLQQVYELLKKAFK